MMYQSMDFKGYDLSNEGEDIVPIGSLNHLSTKYEVSSYFILKKYFNECPYIIINIIYSYKI